MERIETFVVELCRRGRSGFARMFPDSMLVIRLPADEATEFDALTDTGPKQREMQELLERHAGAGVALASVEDLRVKRLVAAAGPRFTVGRTIDNFVSLPARSVSKLHATISIRNDGVEVSDAGSKNGTTVAGVRLGAGDAMELAAGTDLQFGDVAVTYHSPESLCELLESTFPWAKG